MNYHRQQGAGVFVSIAPLKDEGTVRDLARDIKNRIATAQNRAGMRRVLWTQVNEALPRYHAHVVAPFPTPDAAAKFVASINGSKAFLKFGPATVMAEIISDWPGLTNYLLYESTPQAWFAGGGSYPRAKGARGLGDGGGDRVLVSPHAECALIRCANVAPRTRTYASRDISRPTKSKRARAIVAGENQLPLFPQMARPVHRLHEFTGGYAPQTVAQEIAFKMKRKGMTITALAERTGTSRQRLGNFLHGRFGTTEWTIQRIREALAA